MNGFPLFSEDDFTQLTDAFYAKVRVDPLLGPVFATKIKDTDDAWARHRAHIAGFWSSIFLKSGRYKGNPLAKHIALNGITPDHFAYWLNLFSKTAGDVLQPEQAAAITDMSERIAQSLQMGLANHFEMSGVEAHPFEEFGLRRGLRKSERGEE